MEELSFCDGLEEGTEGWVGVVSGRRFGVGSGGAPADALEVVGESLFNGMVCCGKGVVVAYGGDVGGYEGFGEEFEELFGVVASHSVGKGVL